MRMRSKTITSWLLIGSGFLFISGLWDSLTRHMILWSSGVDVNQYNTPHYDYLLAVHPLVGAILLVGGVMLFYLPNNKNE